MSQALTGVLPMKLSSKSKYVIIPLENGKGKTINILPEEGGSLGISFKKYGGKSCSVKIFYVYKSKETLTYTNIKANNSVYDSIMKEDKNLITLADKVMAIINSENLNRLTILF